MVRCRLTFSTPCTLRRTKRIRLQGYPEIAFIHKRLACAASLCLWQTRCRELRHACKSCRRRNAELAFSGNRSGHSAMRYFSVDDIRQSSSAQWVDLARDMSSLLSSLSARHDELGRLTDEAVGALEEA